MAADPPPLRCAAALILDDEGRIFVLRRAPDRELFPGAWDVVGGHLEAGESAAEALRREIFEETGWRLTHVLADLPPVRYTGDDGKVRVEEDFLVRVEGDLRRPRLSAEHTEFRWITLGDLDPLLAGSDRPGDELIGVLLRAGFDTAHDIGLIG